MSTECVATLTTIDARSTPRVIETISDHTSAFGNDSNFEKLLYQHLDIEALVHEFAQCLYRRFSICRMEFSLPELEIEVDLRRHNEDQNPYPNRNSEANPQSEDYLGKLQYNMDHSRKPLGKLTILRSSAFSVFEKYLIEGTVADLCGPLYNSLRYAHACRSAYRDALTGLYNRAALEALLFDGSVDKNRSTSTVMVCDMDRFKWINDHYGHTVGDQALTRFATSLSTIVNHVGSVFRYGGDEFVVALDSVAQRRSVQLAEAIRSTAESCLLDDGTPLTTTIGATKVLGGECLRDAFSRADTALLAGKSSGSNTVVWYE